MRKILLFTMVINLCTSGCVGKSHRDSGGPKLQSSLNPQHNDFTLTFDSKWVCQQNPAATVAQEKTLLWVKGFGGDAVHDKIASKLDVAGYAGLPFPEIEERHLTLIAKFFTLWILYDDYVEKSGQAFKDDVALAFDGQMTGSRWPDLWATLVQDYSGSHDKFKTAMKVDFLKWVDDVLEERDAWIDFRGNDQLPDFDEYLDLRARSAAQKVAANFIFMIHPEKIADLENGEYHKLAWVAAELVALINDLYSYKKDRADENLNALDVFAKRTDPGTADLAALIGLFNKKVREFDEIAAKSQLSEVVVQSLRYNVYGFARWHESAKRYTNKFQLRDGEKVMLITP